MEELGATTKLDLLDLEEEDVEELELKKLEKKRFNRGLQLLRQERDAKSGPKKKKQRVQ